MVSQYLYWQFLTHDPFWKIFEVEAEVEVKLRPTFSRPVCLVPGSHLEPTTRFLFYLAIAEFMQWSALSDERMGL
jgi:hypothetical protein